MRDVKRHDARQSSSYNFIDLAHFSDDSECINLISVLPFERLRFVLFLRGEAFNDGSANKQASPKCPPPSAYVRPSLIHCQSQSVRRVSRIHKNTSYRSDQKDFH